SADRVRRRAVECYLKQKDPEKLIFYAEDVWEHLERMSPRPTIQLMDMERQLAEVADVILIIVESEGAVSELGAFSSGREMRKKLLAIFEQNRRNSGSFIEKAAIEEINRFSRFSPVIFCDFEAILQASHELDDRLARLPSPARSRVHHVSLS